ncbi:MAG: hypothetical protein AAGG72_03775 [Pseudomonadota bacterium]
MDAHGTQPFTPNETAKTANDADAGLALDNGAQAAASKWENPRTVRALTILVVVLGGVLIAGFFTVIGRIIYLTLQPSQATVEAGVSETDVGAAAALDARLKDSQGAAQPLSAGQTLPPGVTLPAIGAGRIEAMTLSGDQLVLAIVSELDAEPASKQTRDAGQPPTSVTAPVATTILRRIIIIDTRTGTVTRQFVIPGNAQKK